MDLGPTPSVSPMTVQRIMKKRTQAPPEGILAIPLAAIAAFVACIEDTLDAYAQLYQARRPLVWMPEIS